MKNKKLPILKAWINGKWKHDFRFLKQYIIEKQRRIKSIESHEFLDYKDKKEDFIFWIGHSTVLIKFNGFYILTDPVFSNHVGVSFLGVTFGPKRYFKPALNIKELPEIDLTLVSHAHYDHLDIPTLSNKYYESLYTITSKGTTDLLPKRIENIVELDWEQSYALKKGNETLNVTAFKVNHPGARYRLDQHRKANGYLLSTNNKTILFFGDTAYTDSFVLPEMESKIDIGLIPISTYDPWIDKHCTPEQAIKMGEITNCKTICPIHFQTFKLSNENMDEPLTRFMNCKSNAQKVNWKIGSIIKF